jgi:hypothetical protein
MQESAVVLVGDQASDVPVWRCPLKSCKRRFPHNAHLFDLHNHALVHGTEFWNGGLNGCEFGCELGFVDCWALWYHCPESCPAMDPCKNLVPDELHCQVCGNLWSKDYSWRARNAHMAAQHLHLLYRDPDIRWKCDYCCHGFVTLADYKHHIRGQRMIRPSTSHAHRLRLQIAWTLSDIVIIN